MNRVLGQGEILRLSSYKMQLPKALDSVLEKQNVLMENQLSSAREQIDRLRAKVKERDSDLKLLKQENMHLRQSERKSLREYAHLELETQEAPQTIKRLKQDLSMAKSKIKEYYVQIGNDSRLIRHMYEERNKQNDQIAHLSGLLVKNDLYDKKLLQIELEKSIRQISELQKLYSDAEKNFELIEKNLTTDNKHLRTKVLTIEKDLRKAEDHVKILEEAVQEKEKAIASLSIYRYNALHKKGDKVCAVCLKREQDEKAERKKVEIKGNGF